MSNFNNNNNNQRRQHENPFAFDDDDEDSLWNHSTTDNSRTNIELNDRHSVQTPATAANRTGSLTPPGQTGSTPMFNPIIYEDRTQISPSAQNLLQQTPQHEGSSDHGLMPPANAYSPFGDQRRHSSQSSTGSDVNPFNDNDDENEKLHASYNSRPTQNAPGIMPHLSPSAMPLNQGYYHQPSQLSLSNIPVFQSFQRDRDEPVIGNVFNPADSTFFHDNDQIQQSNAAAKGDNKIQLLDGKYYSFDYPVPKQLASTIPFEGAKQLTEFSHLRYHAITADAKDYDPNDFENRDYVENYPLRPNLYPIKRETELMIICTMYNEDEVLLGRTLKGVFKNIKYMYNLPEHEQRVHPFGKEAWKKIVVVIVSDGRQKINERSKALLTLLGVFQEGIMQEKVNDKDVNAHLFEYTTTFGIGKFDYHRHNESKGYTVPLVSEQTVPVQLMFLLKEQNKQKINSHRWAFNFLCPNLNPRVVVLLDVGTEPGPNSIYKLWSAFKDPHVGGACGEIRAMLGRHSSPNDEGTVVGKVGKWFYAKITDFKACLINPLIAAQNFEYKISNVLDKPMESAFGFVSVLPGAFSAYRYEALKGDPLKAYFHGEDMKMNTDKPAGVLESNMYLAEDRILCFELVAKVNASYMLRYIHDSFAVTDVPSTVNEFINQRRRWLNGSFFAALYSVMHFYRFGRSNHSFGRKLLLFIEVLYQTINILLSWLSLGSYFLVFRILTVGVTDSSLGFEAGNILAVVFLWIYIIALALTFIISFGNKPNDARKLYILAFLLFSIVMVYMLVCVVLLTVSSVNTIQKAVAASTESAALVYIKNKTFRDLVVSLASTYLLYILGSLLFLDCFHLFACTLQYLLLSPAYINVLSIFAFCNMHDISWGTKGALKVEGGPKKQAQVSEGGELVLSDALQDPDEMYLLARKNIEKPEEIEVKDNMNQSVKNYAKGRTYTVILWLASNFALLVLVLQTGGLDDYKDIEDDSDTKSSTDGSTTTSSVVKRFVQRFVKRELSTKNFTIFMTVILWLVAAMALFRFAGAVIYRIGIFIRRRKFHKNYIPA